MQNHNPLNQIPQLAHVSRPVMGIQRFERLRSQFLRLPAVSARELIQKIRRQRRDIFLRPRSGGM